MFSKKEATWTFTFSSKFHSTSYLTDVEYTLPIILIGGNNEIININPSSPQSTNIIIDQENRNYIAEYHNTRYKEAEFIITGKFKNKCKGEWLIDLTDEEVDRLMPEEDKLCKSQLESIAHRIIEEFDREYKNSDFEYLDFMKIGLWCYKNIKYDYNYVGRTEYNAVDIYNMRKGVCHHFTKLSNALLYSLGYKVLYITGYCIKKNKTFSYDGLHAWSLIKLDDKWYPFDSTWGIVTGKLHLGHIFAYFIEGSRRLSGCYGITFDPQKINGILIK